MLYKYYQRPRETRFLSFRFANESRESKRHMENKYPKSEGNCKINLYLFPSEIFMIDWITLVGYKFKESIFDNSRISNFIVEVFDSYKPDIFGISKILLCPEVLNSSSFLDI